MSVAIRFKKLHCVVPEELFDDLREFQLLRDIDSIVSELLHEKVEELKSKRGGV